MREAGERGAQRPVQRGTPTPGRRSGGGRERAEIAAAAPPRVECRCVKRRAGPADRGGSLGFDGNDIVAHDTHQRQGIGTSLVAGTLLRLRALNAAGCVVVGDPAYYGRFGFGPSHGLAYPDVPPEFFMALSFSGTWPEGAVAYHAAFTSSA